MKTSSDTPIPLRRPWHRLHLSTLLILAGAAVVAATIVLPGGDGQYPEWRSPFESRTSAVVHGWPMSFLWRTPKGWQDDSAGASPALPWKLTDSARDFRLLPLVVDLALAALAMTVLGALAEWRQRRRRALQISLKELLLVVPVAAVALGWWVERRAGDRAARDCVAKLQRSSPGFKLWPRLPLWLRTLAGDERLSWIGLNGPTGSSALTWDRSHREEIRFIIERFPGEVGLDATQDLEREDAAAIASVNGLEEVEFSPGTDSDPTRVLKCLKGKPSIRRLDMFFGDPVDERQMELAASLPRLECLFINGDDHAEPSERWLAALGKCQSLEEFTITDQTVSGGMLDCLGNMPRLRQLDLSMCQLSEPRLGALCRLGNLEELGLRQGEETTLTISHVVGRSRITVRPGICGTSRVFCENHLC